MKGGNVYKSKGKHFTLTLLAVICMTIVIWSYEKKPLATTLFSSQDQLILPKPDVIQVPSRKSEESAKQDEQAFQGSPNEPEETEIKTQLQGSNVNITEKTEATSNSYIVNSENAEELEDKSQPHASSILNAEPLAEESSGAIEDGVNSASSSERKVCDYAKGRWVVDNRRPLYSGFKCKRWLSEMWACRLTQRLDFGYESYKWQPRDCDMPDFERSAFLKRMRDKTIAFVGDSLGRQQFQSLMCMVTGGEESNVQDVGQEYGLATPHGAARPNGWAFRFPETNTTILYYWSSCLCDLVPLNPKDPQSQVAMHLDRPPSFLNHFLDHFDVLILNTGHHWNRGKVNSNRWVMYVDGKPNEDRRLAMIGNAKSFTIHSTAKWVDSQLPNHPKLKAFFRTLSPRHFFNGQWNTGGRCENTTPLARGSEVNQNESSDLVVASALRGTKINMLDITALSQLRGEGHISRYSVKATPGIQDCLHWCLPGIPDTWNEILAAQV